MVEIIITVGIVAVVAFLAGRSLHRTLTGKNEGCGCSGGCGSGACRDLAGSPREQDGDR
jgi:hypothetical protein